MDEQDQQLAPYTITGFLASAILVVFGMPMSIIMFMVCFDVYETYKRNRDQRDGVQSEEMEEVL